jgi:hypothetical protein
MFSSRPFEDPELLLLCKNRLAEGHSDYDVIALLRDKGLSILESIATIRNVKGISLARSEGFGA